MDLDLGPVYGILTFLANQYAELGIDAKKFVGLIFTVHSEYRYIYNN